MYFVLDDYEKIIVLANETNKNTLYRVLISYKCIL